MTDTWRVKRLHHNRNSNNSNNNDEVSYVKKNSNRLILSKKISAHLQPLSLIKQHTCKTTQVGYIAYIDRHSGVLGGIRGYTAYTNLRVFLQRILTSVIINKQDTFRPFATPLCVYPPPFLAIQHWIDIPTAVMMSS